jgi:hypothetical protein
MSTAILVQNAMVLNVLVTQIVQVIIALKTSAAYVLQATARISTFVM